MTRSTSLDTDSQGQDRGDSTPCPEGKRRGTDTPPPRSAHDPAEGKRQTRDGRQPSQQSDTPQHRTSPDGATTSASPARR
ncbi:hypothetical protein WL88_00760 [Burkholderia diffusa]|uniref:Uncharacterized protein n=1 Tax=Burkholderia diffusa TaxID=488732 RepID=A0AAW3PI64_9BURK|nr:hypothetical protein [Burkholderia diffusa]KVC23220.1 hypothetical protein WI69_03825 [Burkholderia diffusa]KWF36754.1 hypothetical protein WL85_13365 [Burkholderia diffusa]KWF42478.1 hypothetical protein WL86_12490 [Burkholderia diffusa]KWF48249.1 hypothetical protein WL87_18925 [Burkholderia diffusa]KWF55530.1 hypothetical protein WL88_00760 [Burkholderia diffusa]